MKQILIMLLMFILITSCSSDDSNGESDNNQPSFAITLEQDIVNAAIDEVITISISANETINRLDISKDGWQTSTNLSSPSFGNQTTIFIDYENTRSKTISIRATNTNGDISESSVNVTIDRGNAIKLQELQLNSFFNINEKYESFRNMSWNWQGYAQYRTPNAFTSW